MIHALHVFAVSVGAILIVVSFWGFGHAWKGSDKVGILLAQALFVLGIWGLISGIFG